MALTNFIDGVTNVPETSTLGQFVMPDPTSCHVFFNDYDSYQAPYAAATTPAVAVPGDFVISGATPGTIANASADGGVLTLTNDNTDAHSTFAQWCGGSGTSVVATFAFDSARSFWMKHRFKISEATKCSFIVGLAAADTTPLDDANGLFWIKAAASTTLQFKAVKSSTASAINVGTMADDTWVTVGLWYSAFTSGDGVLRTYFNNVPSGTVPLTNTPLSSTNLALTLGVLNGTSQTTGAILSVDYNMIAKRRATTE